MPTGTITALSHAADLRQLEQEWRSLESRADGSFFISWSWIGSWLETLQGRTPLYLFRCEQAGALIGLAILTRQHSRKQRIFTARAYGLNQTRAAGLNMNIEYNGLLCLPDREAPVIHALLHALDNDTPDWTELLMSAIPEQSWQHARDVDGDCYWLEDEQFTPWARDIRGIKSIDDILSTLSRNRRWQIRRSIRHYEQTAGPLDCQRAESSEQALEWFEQMGELHTARWTRAGLGGSFANPLWVAFHRGVIIRAFDRGEIQLLKITAGERTLGIVYSFLWRGQVYMLQTGFAAIEDNVQRPGYISHCLAMIENARLGMTIYDFMCGDGEYKATLGTAQPPLYWVRARRKRIANRLEDLAIGVRRRYRKHSSDQTS